PATDVGPLISLAAAERVEGMLAGQDVILGGTRTGAVIAPTVLADPHRDADVVTSEIFGPVACLIPVDGLDDAVARVNATPYGLATGLFTRDLGAAFDAAHRLRVGGVHVNETSSSRVDLMPYGGTKESGFGREGPAFAIQEMSEERLVTFSGVPA
ncbi:MAG: aldehyde dehydrogenase family protein, partial [Pseudomonadota bacterium]